MGTVLVREAQPTDLAAVGDLTLRSYDALTTFSEEYRQQLGNAQLRAATEAKVMVGILADRVVGSLALSLGPTEMFEHRFEIDGDCGFRMLAVAPECEGAGVGRALVQDAIDQCREAGRKRMVITSMEFMHRAHAMYERFGFQQRMDLTVRYPAGIGFAFTLDLTEDAKDHYAPAGDALEPRWYLDPRSE